MTKAKQLLIMENKRLDFLSVIDPISEQQNSEVRQRTTVLRVTINNLPVELWSTDHNMLNVIAKHGECRLSAGSSKSCYHAVKILRDGNSYDVKIIIEY